MTIKKNARLYTAIENMPGYLPSDDSPYNTTNRRDAERVLAGMAADLRGEGWSISGRAKDGYDGTSPYGNQDVCLSIGECDLIERNSDNSLSCMSCGETFGSESAAFDSAEHKDDCASNQ